MFSPEIIAKLQKVRREIFANYDKVQLEPETLAIFSRHFLNPDCQADIYLSSLSGEQVSLAALGEHIITAAPATLASYAERHNLATFAPADLLRCFALDHAHDVADNHIPEQKNPTYALAHMLNVSKVDSLSKVQGAATANLSLITPAGTIYFHHVLVPKDIRLTLGQSVYHHFGVIVALATDAKLAQSLMRLQKRSRLIRQWSGETLRRGLVIDFADQRIFHKDVLGQLVRPDKVRVIKRPGDIKKGKIKFMN